MKFDPGTVVATPGALELLDKDRGRAGELLRRHLTGDWGDVDAEDARSNNLALRNNSRIMSVYNLSETEKIWLITEWDRSVTTFLLPSDY